MLTIVPDTNVLISAFISSGYESELFNLARQEKIKLVISFDILEEFNDVIKRKKFSLTQKEIVDFNTQLIVNADIVQPREKIMAVEDDPDDNIILECSVEAKADYIVSGDKHLLGLKEFRGTPIVRSGKILEFVS